MKLLHTIALSAVAAMLVTPMAAEARVKHHSAAKAGGQSTAAELKNAQAEISELQARLNSLEAKIDQQGSTQQAAASQAASQAQAATQLATNASAKADQAEVTASAATTKADKVGKGLDLVKWAGDTQIHGQVFFNASNVSQHTAGGPNLASGKGFNIKRVYLTVDHTFNKVFSADVTTDIANVVGTTAFNANTSAANTTTTYTAPVCTTTSPTPGKFATTCTQASSGSSQSVVGKGLFIKYAYAQAKLDPALIIRFGSAPLPWIPYVEGNYGHRYVENEIIDEYKNYGTTADWGIHVLGSLANGLISYQVSAVDGAGYRKVYVTKSIDLEGRLSAQYKGFWAAVGGYTGKLALDTEQTAAQTLAGTPTTYHTARRGDVGAGFSNALFNVGGEYFYAKNWLSVPNPASQDSAKGWSLFGNVNFAPKWSVFGRYDHLREIPVLGSGASAASHYYNVGLQWEPVKILDLSLVYKRDAILDHGVATIATQNGTIGGNAIGTRGTYDEFGLWGQVKF